MADDGAPNPYAPPKHDQEPPRGEATLFVRRDERLPEICVKCARTGDLMHRAHTFVTQPQRKNAVMLGALFGALGGAIAGAAAARTQRTAKLDLPICGACNARWDNGRWLVFGGLLLTAVAVLFTFVVGQAALSAVARLGILFAGLGAIIAASVLAKKGQLSALHIDDEGVVILGVSPDAKAAIQQAIAAPGMAQKKKRKKAKLQPDARDGADAP